MSSTRTHGWAAVMVAAILMMLAAMATPAQNTVPFTTLHSFDGTDGSGPLSGLVQAFDGNLYGTTFIGGANNYGKIFKITPTGTLIVLYSFCSQGGCADGTNPVGGLIQAADRNFYGTTAYGGANDSGTVFKITPSGTLTTLYSFCAQSNCADGEFPYAGLVQAADGNFYGTTTDGGSSAGNGTVFKITPSGTLTTVYKFCSESGCIDGNQPFAGLIQASDGNFYGTTVLGGAGGGYGDGTLFKMTPDGSLTTLYTFCSQNGCTDGSLPYSALVQGTDGNFYGTTNEGGANGAGAIFKFSPGGTLITFYSFCSQSGCADGAQPYAGLVRAADGNFYGTTTGGGTYGNGTTFRIGPSGALTTLHSFDFTDGANPHAALVQDTNGSLYGATEYGGGSNDGTVFGMSVGLSRFVETQPASGKIGSNVTILGTNLTGAASVTFNGSAASFKVQHGTAITTTVPAGATTGPVQVVTPSGTLTSNVNFQVEP